MAGDWLPMRFDLAVDPTVIAIAAECGINEHEVVGKLHSIWSWANQQTADGNAPGVTRAFLNRHVGDENFISALIGRHWLIVNKAGVTVPDFDTWNGESAKKRLQAAIRARKRRRNCDTRHAGSVTSALPSALPIVEESIVEKRTVEKRTTEPGGTLPRNRNRTIPQPTNPKPKRAGALGSCTEVPSPSVSEQEISGGGGSVSVSEQNPAVLQHAAIRQVTVLKLVDLFGAVRKVRKQSDSDITTLKRIVDHVIVGSEREAKAKSGLLLDLANEKLTSRLHSKIGGFVKACLVKWGPWPGHKDWRPP